MVSADTFESDHHTVWYAFIIRPSQTILRFLSSTSLSLPISILSFDEMREAELRIVQETSQFLKKRAVIEEEYARSMSKLVKSSIESYGLSDGKAG